MLVPVQREGGTQTRRQKQTLEDAYKLLPSDLHSLLISPQDHLPGNGTDSGLGPPQSIINQDNVPQACL